MASMKESGRRQFIKTAAVAAAAVAVPPVFAGGSDRLRVGIVGCGERGWIDGANVLKAAEGVEITALADLFPDRLEGLRAQLETSKNPRLKRSVRLSDKTCFTGFDGINKVLESGVDLVLLTAPPHFHPAHLELAVDAGVHVFMQKPAAVDPVGVRRVLAATEKAHAKGLALVAGTQRRHDPKYRETIQRIHDGAIGEIVAGQCYYNWNRARWRLQEKQPGWTDMEWMCRNWPYFTWLSGDHICEQHVHNIDAMNWALGSPPARALGIGGRQARTGPEYGQIYDHFSVEYEYPNGARVASYCRQQDGTSGRIGERVVGAKGVALIHEGVIEGENAWRYDGPRVNPHSRACVELIQSIRAGKPLNEGRQLAESTLAAILGRMSAYTGRELTWKWVLNASKLDLRPPKYELGDMPRDEIAIPGQTELM